MKRVVESFVGADRLGRLIQTRKVYFERGSLVGLAVDPDKSPALLNNPVHSGKAQTRSFAYLFGGEERLKNARLHFRAHT